MRRMDQLVSTHGGALARRRYLTNFDPQRLPHLFADVIILGGGVAGLRAAIEASATCDVLVVTKAQLDNSATAWAQGGIAAATDSDDSPRDHARDTLEVACGLAHERIVRQVVEEAPQRIQELLEWGAEFDRVGVDLALGREGGHSANRILHAHGDATGAEIARTLIKRARQEPRIRIFENCFAIDLLTHAGAAVGVVTYHLKYGHQMFWAPTTILATGGAGRVYRETTNPPVATGDGLALALRAGARLRDMEMVQFHPTTLYIAGAARALISEAVRGEGAHLVTREGKRFMAEYDPRGELAPRDIVSRAITREMSWADAACMYLDARHFPPGRFAERFPSIARLLQDFELDPQRDLIPVRPAAHYQVGGVAVDAETQTSLPGLLACGEAAASGLHGANRLASNSLLEGLVFGRSAGQLAAQRGTDGRLDRPLPVRHQMPASQRTHLDLPDVLNSLRSVMGRNVAIDRTHERLKETLDIIEFWSGYVLDKVFDEPTAWETQNLLTCAWCLARGALTREESRGVHFRTDFPTERGEWRRHVDIERHPAELRISAAPLPD